MKFRKFFAAVAVLLMAAMLVPGMSAFAASDIDFTINVDTDQQYTAGMTIYCPIIIKTQNDKGYVSFELFLTYDKDTLNCLSVFENVKGVSTKIEERDGQNGLLISYVSEDHTATKKNDVQAIDISFAVITEAATGEYPLSLKVLSCCGFDAVGNLEDAVVKGDSILSLSMAKDKKLTIIDIGNVNTGGTVDDGSSPNYYTNPTQPQSTVEKKEKSGGSVFGKVILILFGAVVVFGAGVIVGFILCQKRMNEDGYDAAASDTARSRRVSDIGSAFSSLGSRFGRSVYDDDDDDNEGDYYNDRISGKKQAPAKRAKPDEDDDIDTSYFGRAAESQLGRKNVYDDVYDDYVPGSRSAKKNDDEDDYGSYDFLGSRSRRERSDDGYGSFSNEQTAAEEFDDGDDDDDDGFYADRRRYR